MARKLILEIVGDSSSVERAFRRTSAGAVGLERDVSRAARGAAAGSGLFRSMGRSLAFASGGFLAFATGAEFVRKSVDAAQDAEVSQRQLRAQFRASGQDLGKYQGQIDKTTLKLSGLAGFTRDDLKSAFTTIFRSTGDVSKGLRDTAAAADIARGRKISLASAALLEAKAEAGNTGAFRRAGIQIAKNLTVEQALANVRKRFAGQAEAGTTSQQRFGAVLFDTEEIIGAGLLPTLNKYLIQGTAWLQQMDESGRLQKDVATASRDVAKAVNAGVSAFKAVKGAISVVDKVTGSFENTLKLVAGAFVVMKTRAVLAWAGVEGASVGALAAELKVGTTAATVAGRVALFTGEMATGWDAVAASANAAAGAEARAAAAGGAAGAAGAAGGAAAAGKTGLLARAGGVAGAVAGVFAIGDAGAETHKARIVNGRFQTTINGHVVDLGPAPSVKGAALNPFAPNRFGSGDLGLGALIPDARKQTEATAIRNASRPGLSLQGRFNLDQLALAKAQAAGDTASQRKILVAQAAILKAQEASAKKLADRTSFELQYGSILDQIKGIDEATISASKGAATAAKSGATEAKRAAQAHIDLLKQFSVPLNLQVKDARAQALNLDEAPILKKIRAAAQKALKSGRLGLQGQIDAWNEIASVNDQLKTHVTNALGKFREANTRLLTQDLGLTVDQVKALRGRLSQVGPTGQIPNRGVGAFGRVVTPDVVIQHETKLDGRVIERSVTTHQQKRARRNSTQRRGPHAGGGI